MFWWGTTRRCARCGSGHLFRRYFTIVDDCPRCGLHFEREQGYWAGALAINIGLAAAVFIVAFVVALVLTVPDIPVVPLLAVLVPLMILVPTLGYPFSKTIWVAVDRAFLQHLDRNERARRADRAEARRQPDEVDAQREHAVGEVPGGVADDREVLEVALRLVHEALALGTGDRRQRAVAHRGRALAEPGDHRVDIELVSHTWNLANHAHAGRRARARGR